MVGSGVWQLLSPEASGQALGNSRRLAAFGKKAGPWSVWMQCWGDSVMRGGGREDESQPKNPLGFRIWVGGEISMHHQRFQSASAVPFSGSGQRGEDLHADSSSSGDIPEAACPSDFVDYRNSDFPIPLSGPSLLVVTLFLPHPRGCPCPASPA